MVGTWRAAKWMGALFLVLAHHLFDAGWSVPIRRFCEHISNLLPSATDRRSLRAEKGH